MNMREKHETNQQVVDNNSGIELVVEKVNYIVNLTGTDAWRKFKLKKLPHFAARGMIKLQMEHSARKLQKATRDRKAAAAGQKNVISQLRQSMVPGRCQTTENFCPRHGHPI